MVEILAPCGNVDSFTSAINSKADAVYLGLSKFSARQNADNFNAENIKYYVAYAHAFGVKVYVCVNTIVRDDELQDFFETVKAGYLAKVDAFIVQDLFLGKILKSTFPEIVLHLSTQAGVNNVFGALQAKEYGFSRVVLARETNVSEIKAISSVIETEVFVHGANCTCFSGHCYMSSFIGGYSGNRGLCRQPCRKRYKFDFFDEFNYALSLSDLCLCDKLSELRDANVKSFKIEGRMRSREYVEATVQLYKTALNGGDYIDSISKVKKTFNRGNFTCGFPFGEDENLFSRKIQSNLGEYVGKIVKVNGKTAVLSVDLASKSAGKIIRNDEEVGSFQCVFGKEVNVFGSVKVGDKAFVTKDFALKEQTLAKRLKKIEVSAEFVAGKKASLKCGDTIVFSDNVLESAKSLPIDEKAVEECLNKTDVFPFLVELVSFSGGDAFMSKSSLNELRKKLYNALFFDDRVLPVNDFSLPQKILSSSTKACAMIVSDCRIKPTKSITELIFAPSEYTEQKVEEFFENNRQFSGETYLYVPAFANAEDVAVIEELSKNFDGLYFEGAFGIELCKKLNKKPFGGIELNVFNSFDENALLDCKVEKFCLSKELSSKQMLDGGYVFSLGSIKIMSLIYCPNGRNCKNCNVSELGKLTDYANRQFNLRKYRINKCRFELYNESILIAKKPSQKMIFDFSGMEKGFANKLLNAFEEFGFDYLLQNFPHTNGNFAKGVI